MKKFKFFFLFSIFLAHNSLAQVTADGYTDKQSYRAGEIVKFYINGLTSNDSELYLYPFHLFTPVLTINGFNTTIIQPSPPSEPWKNGFGYTSVGTWTVPNSFPSGVYRLKSNFSNLDIPIIIKGNILTSQIVIVVPTNKINAYTTSGGKSLYVSNIPDCNGNIGWNSPCYQNLRATTVSFLRPQYFDNSNIGGFLDWMYPYIQGSNPTYNVSYIADIDLDDYQEIANANLIVIIGHSEYWTRRARLNFDAFINSGKNGLILSGNTMWWQVRYEDDDYTTNYTKLTCYKSINQIPFCCSSQLVDTYCDPLLHTVNWNEPSLKYSILGSIGGDLSNGGYGIAAQNDCNSDSFNGYKIINPNSPVLQGINPSTDGLIKFANGEMDGTVMKNLNFNSYNDIEGGGWSPTNTTSTNFPILDIASLGFYRAEIIAYDRTRIQHITPYGTIGPIYNYSPIIAFQRTCNSGKIINVNSNTWTAYGMSNFNFTSSCPIPNNSITSDYTNIRIITKNMIDLLLNNLSIFSYTIPVDVFQITPSSTNVSYTSCATGSIDFKPCGVTLNNAFKFDNKPNSAIARIENCSSCNSLEKNDNNLQKIKLNKDSYMSILPNPNNGLFKIELNEFINGGEIQIFDIFGIIVYNYKFNIEEVEIEVDMQNKHTGIYIVKIIAGNNIINKKIIVK